MPTPDMIDDGSAFHEHDPLQEQFQREMDPWRDGQTGPIASSGAQHIGGGGQSVDRVPAATDRPISTPWGTAPGAQFAPPDIGASGGGSRVPPVASMPQGLGGNGGLGDLMNLSATAEATVECDVCHKDPCECTSLSAPTRTQAFLNLSSDQLADVLADVPEDKRQLVLSKLKAATRDNLKESDFAIPSERKFPIHDENHARNALARCSGTKYEAAVKAAVKKKYPNIDVNAAQEHQATVFFNLSKDGGQFQDGLLWKVLCKTGTLALSPGPGQVDMEKPLELTPDLFMAAKSAYDDHAYEHVVIPAKHEDAHDPLANHGTVDAIDVLSKAEALADVRLSQKAKDQIAPDPDDTLYMLGGLNFTEPETRGKAERGSILNCSVGFKFNVRPNKQSGKTYPVAIEHVALTQQPWVYGLPSFGTANLGGPFNIEDEVPWDGVYLAVETPEAPPAENPHTEGEGTLPEGGGDGELPNVTPSNGNGETSEMPNETITPEETALESVLADLTARAELAEARAEELSTKLSQTSGVLSAATEQLHTERVGKRIKALQLAGIAPAVLTRVEALLLADKPDVTGEGGLELSATVPGEGAEDAPVEKKFGSITEVVDYILSAIPAPAGFDPSQIETEIALSQREATNEQTTAQKADDVERRVHPERFGSDGARIPASERHKVA